VTPRPSLLVPLAFWAGLATGLLRFQAPVGAFAVAGLLFLLSRGASGRLLAAVAALGAAHGLIAHALDARSCAARLSAGMLRLEIRLTEPAAAGGRAQARPGAACRGAIAVRWARTDAAPAATEATVEGRWIPRSGAFGRAGGTFAVTRVIDARGGSAGTAERLRNSAVASMRALYGTRAPLVEMLLLDRRGEVDRALQDRFADSGLVHLLSISGFHVGLIAGWVYLFLRLARLRSARALAIAAAVAAAYVAFLGWPAPATRAAALAGLLALGRWRQRAIQADALLAQSCLVVTLVDPWALGSLGAWLSATALWGATRCTRWSDRALGPSVLWRTLFSSVGATAATAPLTAGALGSVALVGIGLNFAAIPIAAVAVPGVVLSVLVRPVAPWVAGAFAAGSGLALHLLELLAGLGAAVPGGHLVQEGGLRSALPWVAALGVVVWGTGRHVARREALRRWGWAAAAAAWLPLGAAAWSGVAARLGATAPPATLALHFLDVGQGDAAAIRTPNGRWVVIDAGPRDRRTDAGRRVVVPFLRRAGARTVDALVLSHAHADHIGGAEALLERFPTGLVAEPGALTPDPLYLGFLDRVAERGVRWLAGRPGQAFVVDGVRFAVLHPDTAWAEWGSDLNEDSLVLLVSWGRFRALFAGDAGFPAEERLRGRVGPVSLLKVGHHGSAGSSGARWLAELGPSVAVVSAGAGNRYGHPAPDALARLGAAGAALWRTDLEGTVRVEVDADSMTINGRRGVERYALGQ
jgi:competence protein ComEC